MYKIGLLAQDDEPKEDLTATDQSINSDEPEEKPKAEDAPAEDSPPEESPSEEEPLKNDAEEEEPSESDKPPEEQERPDVGNLSVDKVIAQSQEIDAQKEVEEAKKD